MTSNAETAILCSWDEKKRTWGEARMDFGGGEKKEVTGFSGNLSLAG